MPRDIQAGAAKGWGKLDGTTLEEPSFNIVSIVRGSTGVYTITWDTDFSDADYAVLLMSVGDDTAKAFVETWSTGSTVVHTYLNGSLGNRNFNIAVFGDQ